MKKRVFSISLTPMRLRGNDREGTGEGDRPGRGKSLRWGVFSRVEIDPPLFPSRSFPRRREPGGETTFNLLNPIVSLLLVCLLVGCNQDAPAPQSPSAAEAVTLRIATYNIEDVRAVDLLNPDHPRLKKAAATIQRLRPDILLVNEMTYDQAGVPGYDAEAGEGHNARRFVETFLAVSQGDRLEPIRYRAFTAPSNTGLASGFDLDNNGRIVTEFPDPAPPNADGSPARQTAEERAYGGDTWGFGTFPGQYAMALFTREDLTILADEARTFRLLPWSRMPDALMPVDPATGRPWYDGEEAERFRLSSKSHWDVPVRLPDGGRLHVLASHPTPPAFDGDEQRNVRRNHDEIRFWADYLNGADYIVDDSSRAGGLDPNAHFVILGDLNADPDEGNALDNPIGTWLLNHPRINGDIVPVASAEAVTAYPRLDPDDTAGWGLRVDYVLPSTTLRVLGSGILRPLGADTTGIPVSDHFPVWIDVDVSGF